MATIYVSINGDDTNDGLTKALPKRNVGGTTNGNQAAHAAPTGSHTIYIHNTGVPHTEEAGYMNFQYCDNKYFTISGYNDTQDDVAVEFTQGSGDTNNTVQIHSDWTIGSIEFQKVEFNQDASGSDLIKYFSSSQDISATFDTCIFNQTATSKRLFNSTVAVASPTRVVTFKNCTFNGPATTSSVEPIVISGWSQLVMNGCSIGTGYADINQSFISFDGDIPNGITITDNNFSNYSSSGGFSSDAIIDVSTESTSMGEMIVTDNVGTNIGTTFIRMWNRPYPMPDITINNNTIDCDNTIMNIYGSNTIISGTVEILRNNFTFTNDGFTGTGIGTFSQMAGGVIAYNSVITNDTNKGFAYRLRLGNIELHHNFGVGKNVCLSEGGHTADATGVDIHHNTFSALSGGYSLQLDRRLQKWIIDSMFHHNILDGAVGAEAFKLGGEGFTPPHEYFENLVDYNVYIKGTHLEQLFGSFVDSIDAARTQWDVLDSGSVNDANSLELSSVPGVGYYIFPDGSYAGHLIPTMNPKSSSVLGSRSTRFSATVIPITSKVQWKFVDHWNNDFYFTTNNSGVIEDADNVDNSTLSTIDLWLPPYHTYRVRTRQYYNEAWHAWSEESSLGSRGPLNSYESYYVLNANTITKDSEGNIIDDTISDDTISFDNVDR